MRTIAFKALIAVSALVTFPLANVAEELKAGAPHAAVAARTPKAVIELFTSQGCSSCPAADALLGKLIAKRSDVIALTLATDTWDYLGWKDTLSNPKFGERQKAYAKAFKDMIYTPQAVVNGAAHMNGADERLLTKAIDASPGTRIPLSLHEEGTRLTVEAGADPNASGREATLWLAILSKSVSVPIARGENSGRTLTYYNVVREITPIGMWNGSVLRAQFDRATIMRPGADACAVLLQQGQGGPILGAAMLDRC